MRLYFQDAARIGQKGRTAHVWWKRGERPPGLCDRRFLHLRGHEARHLPYANTEAMQIFLDRGALHR